MIAPDLELGVDGLDPALIRLRIDQELNRFDLHERDSAVALAVRWSGSATYGRISAFCRGVVDGMQPILAQGHPLVLVYDHDIGGLLGIHFKEELQLANAVVSVDSVDLKEFDFIDIGALIPVLGRRAGRHQVTGVSWRCQSFSFIVNSTPSSRSFSW